MPVGGPITRGGFSPLLDPSFRRVHIEVGRERPREYELVHNVDDMGWNPVKDKQISGLGTTPAKPEGTQFPLDRPLLGGEKSFEAEPHGSAIEFTWEMWRDELFGVGREMVAEQARGGRHREELEAWSVFNNAFATTPASAIGFTAGESLCSTAHVGLDGVSRSNRSATDVGFGVTGMAEMILDFETLTDERDQPRLLTPTTMLLSPLNKLAGREVLGSAGKPFTADSEINALIEEDMSWMIVHFFTTLTNWFAVTMKGVHDIWFLWRDRPILDSFDDPWTKNAIFTLYQRHTKGFAGWRGVWGSVG